MGYLENCRGIAMAGAQGESEDEYCTRKIKAALRSLRNMTYLTRQNNLIRDKLKELYTPRQDLKTLLP